MTPRVGLKGWKCVVSQHRTISIWPLHLTHQWWTQAKSSGQNFTAQLGALLRVNPAMAPSGIWNWNPLVTRPNIWAVSYKLQECKSLKSSVLMIFRGFWDIHCGHTADTQRSLVFYSTVRTKLYFNSFLTCIFSAVWKWKRGKKNYFFYHLAELSILRI